MSGHLWSGRFDAAPDPAAFDFGVSFPFDRRLFEDDVTGSLAWADALERAGGARGRGGGAHPGGVAADSRAWTPRSGVGQRTTTRTSTAFVERQLVALIGDDGRRLHTGRSRNEQVSVDFRLYLRRRIPLLQGRVRARRRRAGRSGRTRPARR